ncbi:Calcium-binding EF-hand family protein [Perilla frutescens var. hirtella]|uniref:Calcium-binding EF-hand family protein n=1 Tax=Perilla frutescens var. hirtella TaxID=608512 RepID=A0AAD4JHX7_PERFH|nr:Calcium-binding EF-hand family protein [Perilla frutescens var. hirtella]KAH6833448.1 Calcium-binding EF-hand family protein [Perilla frutescens var. hirtella]
MADDAATWEALFKRFDADGDGRISASELGDALKTLGSATADEIKSMMEKIDSDGDGYISKEEFTNFARANKELVLKLHQASAS